MHRKPSFPCQNTSTTNTPTEIVRYHKIYTHHHDLTKVFEGKILNTTQLPTSPTRPTKNSPIHTLTAAKVQRIQAHMNTYAKLVGNPKNTKKAEKAEKINEVFKQLVHVIAERPHYDYMVEEEVAFQISLKIPLFYIINTGTRFYATYTQLSWWQTNTSISAFFRETNFMPECFLEQHFHTQPGWIPKIKSFKIGVIHQSNGEGVEWEHSWNRLFIETCFKWGPWQLIFEPWWVLSTKDKATYNPDIEEYLGYWRIHLNFKHKFFQGALQKQKDSYQLLGSIALTSILPSLNLTFYYFNGRGPSLSLYKDRGSSWGIGVGALAT